MQKTAKFVTKVVFVFLLICTSCTRREPYVHQRIPIEIQQSSQVVTIEIRSLYGGVQDVGIQCSPEVWNTLTNNAKNNIAVQLKSSDQKDTQIYTNSLGLKGTFCDRVTNVHYLFGIAGEHNAKASVEITFPNAPREGVSADIIVCNTAGEMD